MSTLMVKWPHESNLLEPLKGMRVQIVKQNKITLYPPIGVYESSLQLYKMIDWLGSEAEKDWEETHNKIEKERAINKCPPLRKDLSIRMGSRTLSYVNHLYLLEGILRKGLEETVDRIKAEGLDSDFDEVKYKIEVKRLNAVFRPIKKFRHKVAAHTAYAKPRSDDSELTRFDSLINLIPDNGSSVLGAKSFKRTPNKKIMSVSSRSYQTDTERFFGD